MSRVSYLCPCLVSMLAACSTCHGQTVQLPTFRQFTVSTTVTVPDRGGAYLGGVHRASSASTSRGVPLPGRLARDGGITRTTSSSTTSVHATIIDHAELDRQVLAEAARQRTANGTYVDADADRRADFLSRHVGRSPARLVGTEPVSATKKMASLEELRRRNAAARDARQSEAAAYLEKAHAAWTSGKTGAAKVYFKMAERRAEGDLKLQIQGFLTELSAASRSSLASF